VTADAAAADALPTSWRRLAPGRQLTIVKLAPDGSEAARYPGLVVAAPTVDTWVTVAATWTRAPIELDGLAFSPGDQLREWFSPTHPFNAFAVRAPSGDLRGWYANVTEPARLDVEAEPPLLIWHDLYVDLVGLPDGRFTIRDEDELRASGLRERDAPRYERILDAQAELIRRFRHRLPPFSDRYSPPNHPTQDQTS
jgi:hypothetical protein